MAGFSLVNLGEITKPATTLIEKSSDAVKGLLRPQQTRRVGSAEIDVETQRIRAVAQAEADAAKIHAENEIEITDLHRRAFRRSIEEEAAQQSNMENILGKAIPQLVPGSAPEEVEDDWYTNFYSKCRITSDDEMQNLWARILAGQANNPGSFSRRTVNLVVDLDKRDAELFTNLCRFVWVISGRTSTLIYDVQSEIYNRYGINFETVGHLESLGLVHFSGVTDFELIRLPKHLITYYCGTQVVLTLPNDSENRISQGQVILTQAGLELARISGASGVQDFYNYVYDKWAAQSFVSPREPKEND